MTALRHLRHLLRGTAGSDGSSRSASPASSPTACSRWRSRRTSCSRPSASRDRARSPVRWPSCCCRSACSVRSSGCSWTGGRGGRCWPGRTSCASGWCACSPSRCTATLRGPALFVADPGLPVGQPVPARRAVRRPCRTWSIAEDLVTANALTPTAGTLAFLTGLAVGTGARIGWDAARRGQRRRRAGDARPCCTPWPARSRCASRATCSGPTWTRRAPVVREAVRHVARGLVDGLRHLGERRPAAYALTAIGAHRFFYGISTVALILLYRNYFHDADEVERRVQRAVGGGAGERCRVRVRGRAHAGRHRAHHASAAGSSACSSRRR